MASMDSYTVSASQSPTASHIISSEYVPTPGIRSDSSQPSSQPSPTPSHEAEAVIEKGGQDTLPPPLHLALALWFEQSGCSRTEYTRLREVLQLTRAAAGTDTNSNKDLDETESQDQIQSLPLKLDTLKRQLRRHMPLLKLMRKPLRVIIEKQPSLPQRQKGKRPQRVERLSWQYWYDPIELVRTILSAKYLKEKMYFGMAHYVDEPTELWHSFAWGSSIRAVSGDVCRTRVGTLIIPGDFVRIRAAPYRIGRVLFIGRDYRQASSCDGEIIVTLQAIAESRHLQLSQQSVLEQFSDLDISNNHEFFLLEDHTIEVSLQKIDRHLDILLDRGFEQGDPSPDDDDIYFIRYVLNLSSSHIRPCSQLNQTRGELEVSHFGRETLESTALEPFLSFPYLLFVDDFGIHRNMYRALKAFYLIPACLGYDERRKLANVFTVTLGPHGADIDNVIESLRQPIRELDSGLELDINGKNSKVVAFVMTFLGDMPQQADNAGFLRHTATKGCRSCYCAKNEFGDLEYDTVSNGRYHFETVIQRESAIKDLVTAASRNAFTKDTGIRMQTPPMAKLAPALDLIQSRAYDAPHSEWRGLGRILQTLLITSILTKGGKVAFLKSFQNFQFPPGWKRIQSPLYYVWSWTLSESGKATVLLPLILRSGAHLGWFRFAYLQHVSAVMGADLPPVRAITRAFGLIARTNTLLGSQRYTDPDTLHQLVLESRRAYQQLITCVSLARSHNDDAEDSDTDANKALVGKDEASLQDILSDAIASDVNEDEDHLITESTQGRKGKRKSKDGTAKLLRLPNVHAGLHLASNAREYATVMNSNVLAGELKHKYFVLSTLASTN